MYSLAAFCPELRHFCVGVLDAPDVLNYSSVLPMTFRTLSLVIVFILGSLPYMSFP